MARETDRNTRDDTQTVKQTDGKIDTQTKSETDGKTDRQKHSQTERQTDGKTDRQKNRQMERQTDGKTDRGNVTPKDSTDKPRQTNLKTGGLKVKPQTGSQTKDGK